MKNMETYQRLTTWLIVLVHTTGHFQICHEVTKTQSKKLIDLPHFVPLRLCSTKIMSSSVVLLALLFLSVSDMFAQPSSKGLSPLEGHRVRTYYSEGSKGHAEEMAARCENVISFYKVPLNFEPTVTLLVLSPEDWGKHTSFPVYGMPHYNDDNTLIVASEDNDFWKSFIPPIDQLPAELAHQIVKTYADKDAALTMRGFFDLLAIHELGHAFHVQGGLTMQRKWMGELFANTLLHTYVAEKEPELLPALTIFPKIVVSSTNKSELKFTTLNDLEANYDLIGQQYPNNYGWYQCRWHIQAGDIYDKGGVKAFVNLWKMLKNENRPLNDKVFAKQLSKRVHKSVANVQLKWDK